MRICLYSEKVLPGIGGQEWVVDRLARGFQAEGHEVVVLAPRGRVPAREYDANLPYPVVRHPRFRSTRWFVAAHSWWLTRLHRRRRFDVVHCHSVHPTGYVAARCRAVDHLPLVVTSHGGDIDDVSPLYRKKGLAECYRASLGRANALVAPSGFVEARLRQWCDAETRIERIPHGVDLRRYAAAVARPADLPPTIEPGKYWLFLGRTVWRKGADVLLDAFKTVNGGDQLRLVIAGEGTAHAALVAQAGELGLGERITFLGPVFGDAKTWLLQHALCNVLPSRHSEAFGLTALESFAAGRPVIGTAVPGLTDLIVPEQNGILVPPDSSGELARALQRSIDRPELLERLAARSRRSAEPFAWDKVVRRYLELFEELREMQL